MEIFLICAPTQLPTAIMTTQKRRRFLKTVGGVAVVGTIAGCVGDDDGEDDDTETDEMDTDEETEEEIEEEEEEEEMGDLRVAHLSPDAPNVDVYVDDDPVLEDVPFRDVSEYLELEPDDYTIMVTAAGDEDEVVFDETVSVGDGDYTAAALGELAEENQPFAVEIFEDDLSDPGEDARIRAVHASPDAPAVDVTTDDGETVLFEDVAFGEDDALEVEPDDYTLEIRPATDDVDGEVVAEVEVSPEEGTVYSAFAVGYLEPEAAPADEPFDVEIVVDSEPEEEEEVDDEEVDDEETEEAETES